MGDQIKIKLKKVTACYACQSSSFRQVAVRVDGIPMLACDSCQTLLPEMVPILLSEFYHDHYFDSTEETGSGVGYTEYEINHQPFTFRWAFRLCQHLCPPHEGRLAVLDVGCSSGNLLTLFKENNFRTVGLEFVGKAARKARGRGHDIREMTIENSDFEKGSFEIITALEVLEHLEEFESFFSKVNYLLKDDGIFVAHLPLGVIESFSNSNGNYKWLHESLTHTVYFSTNGLRQLVERYFGHSMYAITRSSMDNGLKVVDCVLLLKKGEWTPYQKSFLTALDNDEINNFQLQDDSQSVRALFEAKFGNIAKAREIAVCHSLNSSKDSGILLDLLAVYYHEGAIISALDLMSKIPRRSRSIYSVQLASNHLLALAEKHHIKINSQVTFFSKYYHSIKKFYQRWKSKVLTR